MSFQNQEVIRFPGEKLDKEGIEWPSDFREESVRNMDEKIEEAMRYLKQKPTSVLDVNCHPSRLAPEGPWDIKGRNIPSTFYEMLAKIFIETLRGYFGNDVIIGGGIFGSVARGTAKVGSDIDGSIYVANEHADKIDAVKSLQRKLFQYVATKIGYENIRSCDFGANVFTAERAEKIHSTKNVPRIRLQ